MQVDGGVVREFPSNCLENKKRLDYYKDWFSFEVILCATWSILFDNSNCVINQFDQFVCYWNLHSLKLVENSWPRGKKMTSKQVILAIS